MGGMDELVAWLRAVLDEVERMAKAATPGPWSVDNVIFAETILAGDAFTAVVAGGRWGGEASVFNETADAIHIALHDPASALADVAAKRRILGWCVEVIGSRDLSRYGEVGCLRDDPDSLAVTLAVETIRLVGLSYASWPGYRPHWKPEPTDD